MKQSLLSPEAAQASDTYLHAQMEAFVNQVTDTPQEGVASYYLYDPARIAPRIEGLARHLPPQVQVYYAVKANPHPAILAVMAQAPHIAGVEVASGGELDACLSWFPPGEVLFSGPAKTSLELEQALHHRIRQIHIESLTEFLRLEHLVSRAGVEPMDVLVRVNPSFEMSDLCATMARPGSKFGIDEEQLPEMVARVRASPHLRLRGIHVFAGSGLLDAELFLDFVAYVLGLHRRTQGLEECDRIDLGGGFGVDYCSEGRALDLEVVGAGLSRLIKEYGVEDKEIILELGRFLVAECGFYVTPIIDIKVSGGKKILLTGGGINHFRRPLDHGINHPMRVIRAARREAHLADCMVAHQEGVDVGGPLCTPRDFIARDLHVEHAEVGDYLVVELAGAYGLSTSPVRFLSHPEPRELFWCDVGAHGVHWTERRGWKGDG